MTHQEFCRWCVEHHCEGSVMLNIENVTVGTQQRAEWVYTITLSPVSSVLAVPSVTIKCLNVGEGMEMAMTAMGRLL
jgi:hypothetical protein